MVAFVRHKPRIRIDSTSYRYVSICYAHASLTKWMGGWACASVCRGASEVHEAESFLSRCASIFNIECASHVSGYAYPGNFSSANATMRVKDQCHVQVNREPTMCKPCKRVSSKLSFDVNTAWGASMIRVPS